VTRTVAPLTVVILHSLNGEGASVACDRYKRHLASVT
jgi:hypothetical protein